MPAPGPTDPPAITAEVSKPAHIAKSAEPTITTEVYKLVQVTSTEKEGILYYLLVVHLTYNMQ